MTLEKARHMLSVHAGFGSFYNANAARTVLAEVQREHGQMAVDALITETGLDRVFSFRPGQDFSRYAWKK